MGAGPWTYYYPKGPVMTRFGPVVARALTPIRVGPPDPTLGFQSALRY